MPAIARMRAVVLDCPDPRALAGFYRALVGGETAEHPGVMDATRFDVAGFGVGPEPQ